MIRTRPLILALLFFAPPAFSSNDLQPGATPANAQQFRIMSDVEIAEHQAAMSALHGQARDNYRNQQYRQLQERARKQGYQMPAQPPWQQPLAVPQQVIAAPAQPTNPQANPQQDTATLQRLIAEQKQVIEQARLNSAGHSPTSLAKSAASEVIPNSGANPAPQPNGQPASAVEQVLAESRPAMPRPETMPAATATPKATSTEQPTKITAEETPSPASNRASQAYRNEMRRRFDDFMSQRQSRQDEENKKRAQEKNAVEARRQQFSADIERRRQAYREKMQRPAYPVQPYPMPRYAPVTPMMPVAPYGMPQPPYGYPQPMPYPGR